MYRIDKKQNNIEKLDERLFKDLKIRERDHLQEWIAHNPDILGEELLIIQKEFDGFNDTQERLDLLALDKQGGLVIIENKLDDSGRNVVWQALKYASYCSTLTTNQIVKIYNSFLEGSGEGGDAKENIVEFLDSQEEELLLNHQDQRIIFVANHYRKEVTSTVLWLLNHEVQIQCFKATPYSMGEELFLQMEQIIPLPETTEFMIDAKQKEKEQKIQSKVVAETNALLVKFWSGLKDHLQHQGFDLLARVAAKPHYSIGSWKGSGKFSFCIGRHGLRVEYYFNNDPTKASFDALKGHQKAIEEAFGRPLEWERLDGKKASRVKSEKFYSAFDYNNTNKVIEQEDPALFYEWFGTEMERLYSAIIPILDKVEF